MMFGLIVVSCKGNANERNVSLLTDCRVQLAFCKGKYKNLTGNYLYYGFVSPFHRFAFALRRWAQQRLTKYVALAFANC